jgi:hypothetical protein
MRQSAGHILWKPNLKHERVILAASKMDSRKHRPVPSVLPMTTYQVKTATPFVMWNRRRNTLVIQRLSQPGRLHIPCSVKHDMYGQIVWKLHSYTRDAQIVIRKHSPLNWLFVKYRPCKILVSCLEDVLRHTTTNHSIPWYVEQVCLWIKSASI